MGQTLKFIPNPVVSRFGDRVTVVSMHPLQFIKFAVWSTSNVGIAEVFVYRLNQVRKEDLLEHLKLSHTIPFSESSFEFYIGQITEGFPIDIPFLDMEVCGTGAFADPIGHEGRHRALAAYSLGIDQIPVYVFPYCNHSPINFSQLTREQRQRLDLTLTTAVVQPRAIGTRVQPSTGS